MAFDFSTINDRIDAICAAEGTERGRGLEQLVSDVLSSIPGVEVPERNVLPPSGVEEVDLLVTNQGPEHGLQGFEHDLLCECKSSIVRVNSHMVGWFAQQLRRRHMRWGMLVSLAGISGDADTVRHAQREIERSAQDGQQILILVEHELRGLRSVEHLIALLQAKRDKMRAGARAWVAADADLAELDPTAGNGRQGLRGWDAFRAAVLSMEHERLDEVLAAARGEEDATGRPVLEVVRERFAALDAEAARHSGDPDHDPMWLHTRALVVDAGAAAARLIGLPQTEEALRVTRFEINGGPKALRAYPSSRLWTLLTNYYVEEAAGNHFDRERAAYALLTMVVEAMMGIDDIDPPDPDDLVA
jgi:hypothetical protein